MKKRKGYWPGWNVAMAAMAFLFSFIGAVTGDDAQFFGWFAIGLLCQILEEIENQRKPTVVNVFVNGAGDDR